MKRPDPQQLEALSHMARHNRDVVEFLVEWKERELNQLPSAVTNTGIFQGRCQVLQELVQLLQEAQNPVAKR